jgi:2,3-bisphosphoglycerate-dependent phosphoglycerate mutase
MECAEGHIFIIMFQQCLKMFGQFSGLRLVIVRHGQSECNKVKKWSGWSDAQLTAKGESEAVECAKNLQKAGCEFDLAYCSYLSRSSKTLNIIKETAGWKALPVK